MHISAKADYAVRVMLEIAAHGPDLVKSTVAIGHQDLPRKFVESILVELRHAELVRSHRGAEGGYTLGRPAAAISIGEIVRAVDGPLAEVRGIRPHECEYTNAAENLAEVWVAARAALRTVLDETSLAHVLAGRLPAHVRRMTESPGAWLPR
ncbi:Rrf2 family protein [Catenulispora sp. MAP12-49]|uniref:RrF2 family transcriptional regulator n=1 Tax=Catenulispora sp. MAP12-49 TaxID=3156302 RepID=UPI00351687F4